MDPFRDELAAAHAKIEKLETDLARLKRGFDPPPLANPISEEEHRANQALQRKPGNDDTANWMLLVFFVVVIFGAAVIYIMISKA